MLGDIYSRWQNRDYVKIYCLCVRCHRSIGVLRFRNGLLCAGGWAAGWMGRSGRAATRRRSEKASAPKKRNSRGRPIEGRRAGGFKTPDKRRMGTASGGRPSRRSEADKEAQNLQWLFKRARQSER